MLIDKKIKITIQDFFPNGDDFEITNSQAVVDIQDFMDMAHDIVDLSSHEILDRLIRQPLSIDNIGAEAKNNNHVVLDVEQIAYCIELATRLIRKHQLDKLYLEVNPIDPNNLMD